MGSTLHPRDASSIAARHAWGGREGGGVGPRCKAARSDLVSLMQCMHACDTHLLYPFREEIVTTWMNMARLAAAMDSNRRGSSYLQKGGYEGGGLYDWDRVQRKRAVDEGEHSCMEDNEIFKFLRWMMGI